MLLYGIYIGKQCAITSEEEIRTVIDGWLIVGISIGSIFARTLLNLNVALYMIEEWFKSVGCQGSETYQ